MREVVTKTGSHIVFKWENAYFAGSAHVLTPSWHDSCAVTSMCKAPILRRKLLPYLGVTGRAGIETRCEHDQRAKLITFKIITSVCRVVDTIPFISTVFITPFLAHHYMYTMSDFASNTLHMPARKPQTAHARSTYHNMILTLNCHVSKKIYM